MVMRHCGWYLLLCVLISLLTTVQVIAQGSLPVESGVDSRFVSLDIEAVNTSISRVGKAHLRVTLESKVSFEQPFSLRLEGIENWRIVYSDPVYVLNSENVLKENEKLVFDLYFAPSQKLASGIHNIRLEAIFRKVPIRLVRYIPLTVIGSSQAVYLPNIRLGIEMPPSIDPRSPPPIKLVLDNKNKRHNGEINLLIESDIIGKKEVTTSLAPEEQGKIVELAYPLDPLQEPLKDTIRAVATIDGVTFTASPESINVIDYAPALEESQTQDHSLFKTINQYSFVNAGNAKKTATVRVPVNIFSQFLYSSEVPPTVIAGTDGRYLIWQVAVPKKTTVNIVVIKNSRPVVIVALLLLLLWLYYYTHKSPVTIHKHVLDVETKEGGIAYFKVLLEIKNTANVSLHDFEISEALPHLVEYLADSTPGMVSPTKILVHESRGNLLLKWNIDEIDPLEDRLISYRVKTKLSILGGIEIGPSVIRFRTTFGKRFVSTSNRVIIRE